VPIRNLRRRRQSEAKIRPRDGTIACELWRAARFGFASGVGVSTAADPRTNLAGDPYLTDGLRLVVFLGAKPRSINKIEFLDWQPHHNKNSTRRLF
jgi:hypothetical protein